jgi:hypothetical protein
MPFRFRYVTLPANPTLAQLDDAMLDLRRRRKATGFPIVQGWIQAEMDAVLELRTERTYQDATVALLQT